MHINQKTCGDNRIINALIDQVSALQIDVAQQGTSITNLDNSKANAEELKESFSTDKLTTPEAVITTGTITNVHAAEIDASDAHLTNIESTGKVDVNGAEIESLEATKAVIGTAEIANETVGTLTVNNDFIAKDNITAENIKATAANITGITSEQATIKVVKSTSKIEAADITATGKTEITDLEVTGGNITGVTLDATSMAAREADLDKIETGAIIMSDINEKIPSGSLGDDDDAYTIQLPVFTGSYYLVWKNNENVIWSAVVNGNGCDYSVSWNVLDKDKITVTNFFQYANQIFIRTNSNGVLYYISNTTEELSDPTIYFNMQGWEKGDLEDLCDERHQYDAVTALCTDGIITFGAFYAPSLTGEGGELQDNLEVKNLKVTNSMEIVPETIVWNSLPLSVSTDFNTDWIK